MYGKQSEVYKNLDLYIEEELIIFKIIKESIFYSLIKKIEAKNNFKKVLFALTVNSCCCCCGKVVPIFSYKYNRGGIYGSDRQYWDDNGYFEGKFCSKYCWRRLDDFQSEEEYPPYHQVLSGREGEGFFEHLNIKYSDIELVDLSYKRTKIEFY